MPKNAGLTCIGDCVEQVFLLGLHRKLLIVLHIIGGISSETKNWNFCSSKDCRFDCNLREYWLLLLRCSIQLHKMQSLFVDTTFHNFFFVFYVTLLLEKLYRRYKNRPFRLFSANFGFTTTTVKLLQLKLIKFYENSFTTTNRSWGLLLRDFLLKCECCQTVFSINNIVSELVGFMLNCILSEVKRFCSRFCWWQK